MADQIQNSHIWKYSYKFELPFKFLCKQAQYSIRHNLLFIMIDNNSFYEQINYMNWTKVPSNLFIISLNQQFQIESKIEFENVPGKIDQFYFDEDSQILYFISKNKQNSQFILEHYIGNRFIIKQIIDNLEENVKMKINQSVITLSEQNRICIYQCINNKFEKITQFKFPFIDIQASITINNPINSNIFLMIIGVKNRVISYKNKRRELVWIEQQLIDDSELEVFNLDILQDQLISFYKKGNDYQLKIFKQNQMDYQPLHLFNINNFFNMIYLYLDQIIISKNEGMLVQYLELKEDNLIQELQFTDPDKLILISNNIFMTQGLNKIKIYQLTQQM